MGLTAGHRGFFVVYPSRAVFHKSTRGPAAFLSQSVASASLCSGGGCDKKNGNGRRNSERIQETHDVTWQAEAVIPLFFAAAGARSTYSQSALRYIICACANIGSISLAFCVTPVGSLPLPRHCPSWIFPMVAVHQKNFAWIREVR